MNTALLALALSSAAPAGPEASRYGVDLMVEPLAGGESFHLDRYRGQLLVVTFFASWCEACPKLAPELGELVARLQAEGVSIALLGLSAEVDAREALERYVRDHKPPFEVGLVDPAVTRGSTELGRVERLPTTWVLGRSGVPLYRYEGSGVTPRIAADLERYRKAEGNRGP